jgi:hypothetical protein
MSKKIKLSREPLWLGEPLWLSCRVVKNEKINEIERTRVRSPPSMSVLNLLLNVKYKLFYNTD